MRLFISKLFFIANITIDNITISIHRNDPDIYIILLFTYIVNRILY